MLEFLYRSISWDSLSRYLDDRAITTALATIQDLMRIIIPTRMFFTGFLVIELFG